MATGLKNNFDGISKQQLEKAEEIINQAKDKTINTTEDASARVHKHKGSKVKRALAFKTKNNKSKLA